jgi:hypothetical protein
MNELLSWLAVIFTGLAVLVAIVVYRLQTKTKQLSYQIVTNSRLVTAESFNNAEHMRVYFGRRRVHDPRLLVVRLVNTGNTEIRPSDFEQHMEIAFEEGTKLVSIVKVDSKPTGLDPRINTGDDGRIAVSPLLMNEGDSIELQMLIDGDGKGLNVSGRVAGVKQLVNATGREIRHGRRTVRVITWSLMTVLVIFVASIVVSSGLEALKDQARVRSLADGSDPEATKCGYATSQVDTAPISLKGEPPLGSISLIRSGECKTLWARVEFDYQQLYLVNSLTLTARRPSDNAVISVSSEPRLAREAEFESGMLKAKSCVQAEALLVIGKKDERIKVHTSCQLDFAP